MALAPSELADYSFVGPSPGGDFIAYPNDNHLTFLDVRADTVGEPLPRGRGFHRGGGTWHPDGVYFALATGGRIRVWNARTNEEVVHGGRGPDISSIAFNMDGSRLVTGELSGRVTMLDPSTLEPIGRPVMLDDSVSRVAAGPDDHTVVALTGDLDASEFWVSTNPRWAVVDLESGTVLDRGELGIDGYAVAFSPDGRHVAVGGRDGEVLVLDLRAGEPVRRPVVGHDDVVLSVTYSADGKRLLTSGPDSRVGLWDAETGRLLARVVVPTRYTVPAFRTEEDSVLIAPLSGGPVLEWDTRVEDTVDFACAVAGRDLTEAEWTEQFGDRPYQQVCPS